MGVSGGPDLIQDGLVLALDASDRNSYVSGSSTWFDVAGSNNGTLTNGPTFNTGSGGSIVFDGVDDYVGFGSANAWAFGSNGTVSTWCYFTGSVLTNHRIWCVNNNNNSLDAYISAGASFGRLGLHGSTALTVNQFPTASWVYVTATYAGGTLQVYFNGVPQALTGTTSGYSITNSSSLFLGKYTTADGYRWRGNISSTSMYNRGLSADEVLQNYNAQKSKFGL